MIKTLIKLAALAVVALLAYNFFFGSEEEKAQTREVFDQVKELGRSIGGILVSEKEKFQSGKYDDSLNKIGGAIDDLKSKASQAGDRMSEKFSELDDEKRELKSKYERLKENATDDEISDLFRELKQLAGKTENFAKDLSRQDKN